MMGKSKSRKGQVFKKPKLNITFDPQSRIEYLSGFHKRKLERKAFHKAKLVKQVAAEKIRIREKVKQSVGKVSSSHSVLPEVEALLGLSNKNAESTPRIVNTFEMGSKVVTVSSLDNIHIKPEDIDNSGSEDGDGGAVEVKLTTTSISKKAANRMLQNSKAFKASQRLKQKSKKSRGQNRKKKHRTAEKDAPPATATQGQPRRRKGQTRAKKLAGKR